MARPIVLIPHLFRLAGVINFRKDYSPPFSPNLQTLDLNTPAEASNAIVLVDLVNLRVNQLDGGQDNSGDSMLELLRKQKRGTSLHNARSATAASDSPRREQ